VADQGGLIDMRSVVVNYTIFTTGVACPDDGHPFSVVQVLCNGQLLDNIQNAAKLTNIEAKMGMSRSYYQGAGSMQGFELLNPDLTTTVPLAGTNSVIAQSAAWGYVTNNTTDIAARSARASNAVFNNIAGEQRSIPLGLLSGVGRMEQYLPVSLLGEIQFVLITGSAGEMLFDPSATQTGDYSLSQVSLEYDIVVPSTPYASLLQHIAAEDGEKGGLNMPFESSVMVGAGTFGTVGTAATSLTETTLIASRATNHLLRSSIVQIPTLGLTSLKYPSQSCFSHGLTQAVQWRCGSQVFPQIAAQGDASIYNMSLNAYGSVVQEQGSVINRALWANSTDPTTAGTTAVFATAQKPTASGATAKFAYADSFIPTYGFRTVKGASDPLDVDGISLAGASGSQLIATLVSAPPTQYQPYMSIVALKFIKAKGGAVSVVGA
jgi:hypothetical protein